MDIEGNRAEAEKYYKPAIEQGDEQAAEMKSKLFKTEKAWDKFIDNAMKLKKRSCNSTREGTINHVYELFNDVMDDDPTAQYNLANLLRECGERSKGDKFCKMAADQGMVDAQFNYVVSMYYDKKLDVAEKYYRMAADQGLDIAQYNLAVMLDESGRVEEAERYFRMAAEQENTDAIESLVELLEKTGSEREAKKFQKMLDDN